MRLHPAFAFSLVLCAACGDDAAPGDATDTQVDPDGDVAVEVDTTPDDTRVDGTDTRDEDTLIRPETVEVAEPLEAPEGEWAWFDQPGSACSDGTTTGFAVNRGTRDDVLVVLMGGGACWDFDTCFLHQTAATGPFKRAQFDALGAGLSAGVLDRGDEDNPFRDWSFVFVPYCTGDLHAGEAEVDYTSGGITRTWHHAGAVNVRLLLPRVAATFPRPSRLVVSGLSAGGYGAVLQYGAFRDAFEATTTMLLDDSGPFLVGETTPAAYRSAWFSNWRLDRLVDPVCGQTCKSDLTAIYPALAERYPDDRMALVSSLQDAVIAAYFKLAPADMQAAIEALTGDVLAPLPSWRTFLVPGDGHTTLADPDAVTTAEVNLEAWLALMVEGDAGWSSVAPE